MHNHNHNMFIDNYLNTLFSAKNSIDIMALSNAINILLTAIDAGGNIYIMGNGGSASTASHIQNDFNSISCPNAHKRFQVICLADNLSTITAIANDYSYELVFERQLHNRLSRNDVLIAFSGSGNSVNIIKAVNYAKSCDVPVIAMTGYDGGELLKLADCNIHIPINNMQIAECYHLIFGHIITSAIRKYFLDRCPTRSDQNDY